MITKWRWSRINDEIVRVECAKETDKTVVLGGKYGRRENKISDYHCYFDTWAEAHAHALRRARDLVGHAEARLTRAKATLAALEAAQPPQE